MSLSVDWRTLFIPSTSIIELLVRGSLMYLAMFFLLRIVLKREIGTMNMADLLVLVLLAEAAQNGIADDYTSISEGIILVMTIIFWSHTLDWVGYRFPRLRRFVRPAALLLVKDGQLLQNNMREELVTEEELMSQLRLSGVEDVSEVKIAYMEGNGRISVIVYERGRRAYTNDAYDE